jgi:hypothetical protein
MDKKKKLSEELLKADGINPVGVTESERIAFGRMLDAQFKLGIIQPNIWRTIMKSKITKLATAAVIIIAIMLGMYVMTDSFDGTSITMAQVRQAMENIDWMQLITKSEIEEGMNIVWYSFATKVEIVNAKPGISYSDFKTKKDLFWRREGEYIYESPIETKEFAYGTSGPFEMIDKTLSLAQAEHGKDIVKEIGTYQNQKVEIWTASHVKRGSKRTIIVYIDIDRKLPIAATYKRIGTDSVYPEENYIEFRYPETGPADIYEAGAPRTAHIKLSEE